MESGYAMAKQLVVSKSISVRIPFFEGVYLLSIYNLYNDNYIKGTSKIQSSRGEGHGVPPCLFVNEIHSYLKIHFKNCCC